MGHSLQELLPAVAEATATRTYQRKAIVYGAKRASYGLFDQPGLGKTLEALGAIVKRWGIDPTVTRRHLVFAPKTAVRSVWAPEVQRWVGDAAAVFPVVGDRTARTATLEAALASTAPHVFVIVNLEMARIRPEYGKDDPKKKRPKWHDRNAFYPKIFSTEWDTVVVDEVHRALIRTSGTPTQQRAGFRRLRTKGRIALSGTPMRGKPEQLWGTLNWLDPVTYSAYWKWVSRYFEVTSDGYSDYVIGAFQRGGEKRLERDIRKLVLRRTKTEVLPELPPKTYTGSFLLSDNKKSPFGIWLPLEGNHRTQYKKFESDGALSFDDGELIANGVLAEYTRRSQLANCVWKMEGEKFLPTIESPKWDWLLEKFEALGVLGGEGDGKIVVASKSTALLKVWHAEVLRLGVRAHLLTGDTSEKRRAEYVKDFQEHPETRVFMLNVKAGGVAVTLDAADDLVLIDETTVPDDTEQVEDRLHRTSRIHNVNIHILRTLDTQDEEIAWVSAARENVQKYLLDGTRGVETARQLFLTKTQTTH